MRTAAKWTLRLAPITVLVFWSSASVAVITTDAQTLFEEASRLQNGGKFAAALGKWREFIAAYPSDPSVGQAYGGLGVCLLETGEFTKAIEAFDSALARLPQGEKDPDLRWNHAVACYRRAEKSKQAKDYQQAAGELDAISNSMEHSKERRTLAGFYLAKIDQTQGRTAAAKERFQQLVTAGQNSTVVPFALLALGSLAQEAKDWTEAIRLYERFLRDYTKHASADEARLGLADAFLKVGRLEEAERLFGELRQHTQFASAPYAQYRWGEAAFLRENYQAAVERLREFLIQYPKSEYRPAALFATGEAQVRMKDYTAAAKTLSQFVNEFPDHADFPRVKLRLAQALYDAGELAQAESTIADVLTKLSDESQRSSALVLHARCAAKLKHAAEAVRRYEVCLTSKVKLDEPEQVRYEAVTQAFAAGDSERGLAWTAELVTEAPKNPLASQAQLHAARWLTEAGKFDDALTRCRWVLDAKVATAQPLALYLSGFCSMKLRKFEDAVNFYGELLESNPRFEQAGAACFSLGVAYEALGAKSKAIEIYQKMDKNYPEDPLTRRARERVKALQVDG